MITITITITIILMCLAKGIYSACECISPQSSPNSDGHIFCDCECNDINSKYGRIKKIEGAPFCSAHIHTPNELKPRCRNDDYYTKRTIMNDGTVFQSIVCQYSNGDLSGRQEIVKFPSGSKYKTFKGQIGTDNGYQITSYDGHMTFLSDDKFEGRIINNKKEGYGKYTLDNCVYSGPFENDRRNGFGVEKCINNYICTYKYSGTWSNDKKHGSGEEEDENTYYKGGFSYGARHGTGVIKTKIKGWFVDSWSDEEPVTYSYGRLVKL